MEVVTEKDKYQDLILSCKSKAKILKWHVIKGEPIKKDSVLATYIFTEKVADANNFIVHRRLKSKCTGSVVELSVNPNEEVQRGYITFVYLIYMISIFFFFTQYILYTYREFFLIFIKYI